VYFKWCTTKKIKITYGQNLYVMAKNPYIIILHMDLYTDENPYFVCNLPTEYYIRIYSVCNEY